MSGIRLMLIISFFGHHTRAVERPVVTLTPNWTKIFKGEPISLKCDAETTGQRDQIYYWYKNNWKDSYGQIKHIHNAEMYDKGTYQCSYGESALSDPVQLDISYDWLILQTNFVYEGDTLTLRCHGWDSSFMKAARFFKDNALLYSKDSIFNQEKITREATGRYRCVRARKILSVFPKEETAETFVTVHELFSEPSLKVIDSPVTEGDAMTLKCDTSLAPARRNTMLQFAFYKGERSVQGFRISDTYRAQSVQTEDSGYYTCKVRTASDMVRKSSKALSIQIQALFSKPAISVNPAQVTEGDEVTLKCDATLAPPTNNAKLQFAFYKDRRAVQDFRASNAYKVRSAHVEDSGNYACDARTANAAVRKRSEDSFIQIKAAYGQTQFKLSVNEAVLGDSIVLSCKSTIKSLPVRYTFYHNGTSLSNLTVPKTEAASVRLNVTSQSMAGFYYCISDNGIAKQKQLSNTVSLLVVDPVSGANIVLDKAGESFVLGGPVTFTCSVERGTSPSFRWTHNGKPVEKHSWVHQLRDHGKVLYIDALRYHHAGSYQCTASNKLSTNRTFSVISNTQNIKILQHSPVEGSTFTGDDDPTEETSVPWFLLGVLTLVVVVFGVLFVYRHKVASVVPWLKQQANPGPTFAKVKPRVGQITTHDVVPTPNSTNNIQEDYSNVSNVAPCADGDVCYSYIHINQTQGPTDKRRGQDEFSVTYSAVKCPGTKMDGQKADGQTVGRTELYENFSSKPS